MSSFVFVHGAWHGAWCWSKVVSLLEGTGHRAIALDLPGHGRDDTPITQVTFEAYCNKLREILEAQTEPVILVGHSMGGRVITRLRNCGRTRSRPCSTSPRFFCEMARTQPQRTPMQTRRLSIEA
jgi:alpha-beta hydrolase superfamily lysophospholipase